MAHDVGEARPGGSPAPPEQSLGAGTIRRVGSAAGLAAISVLDLLALEDITTAGAWMPEAGFLVASVPALVVLAYYAFRRSGGLPADEPTPPEQPRLTGPADEQGTPVSRVYGPRSRR